MNALAFARSTTDEHDSRFYKGRISASTANGNYRSSKNDYIKRFYSTLSQWRSDTAFSSDPNQITNHPCFVEIVSNAKLTTPLIVEELRKQPSLLVWALDSAYREKPYNKDIAGNILEMTNAWISWAERNGRSL